MWDSRPSGVNHCDPARVERNFRGDTAVRALCPHDPPPSCAHVTGCAHRPTYHHQPPEKPYRQCMCVCAWRIAHDPCVHTLTPFSTPDGGAVVLADARGLVPLCDPETLSKAHWIHHSVRPIQLGHAGERPGPPLVNSSTTSTSEQCRNRTFAQSINFSFSPSLKASHSLTHRSQNTPQAVDAWQCAVNNSYYARPLPLRFRYRAAVAFRSTDSALPHHRHLYCYRNGEDECSIWRAYSPPPTAIQ